MKNALSASFSLITANLVAVVIFLLSLTSFYFFAKNKEDKTKKLFLIYSRKHKYEELDEGSKKDIARKYFLDGKSHSLMLQKIITLTNTVKIFIFSYPYEYDYFGLGICKHIKFKGVNIDGKIKGQWNNNEDKEKDLKEIFRSYTPVYIDKKNKHVHFIIRIYNQNKNYIDGGKMSIQLNKLHYKDEIEIAGPFGLLEYKGNNEFSYLSKVVKIKKHIVMIAGGTGMTPFFRLINHLLLTKGTEKKEQYPPYITFIYANRNEEEILLKPVFDEYDKAFENFKIVYSVDECLDSKTKGMFENVGYINNELLKKYVLKYEKLDQHINKDDTLILLCGPPPMTTFLKKILKDQIKMENIITL
ncbi:NADH-cytochrome b5 reductase [Plasmodium brasilianum]|uniref:NADH-cytochrome b5 reductase, putative n=2 Tax=Plasmodium (Plasmodium) TaxID=418103 RepID=A0A1A8W4Q1_PLAMA|nr:NADH-cytochrome b5 reductase, putative [Plasmodium malariae]KAI4837057.1 NADH-cytochrome b5 reductase [Plasmodium brasilianum]SBS86652.1 NADH-cytochrome b5 reductase, putative [Plasmodium malariae]SCO92936.1 NADH-cytochrome b5 reductase, putative [Plasmodium malariae]